MCARKRSISVGENLVKQDLITRDDLERAKEAEADTGTPWYKLLVKQRKVSFGAIEELLRYEFHSNATIPTTHRCRGVCPIPDSSDAAIESSLLERLTGGALLTSPAATRVTSATALRTLST